MSVQTVSTHIISVVAGLQIPRKCQGVRGPLIPAIADQPAVEQVLGINGPSPHAYGLMLGSLNSLGVFNPWHEVCHIMVLGWVLNCGVPEFPVFPRDLTEALQQKFVSVRNVQPQHPVL